MLPWEENGTFEYVYKYMNHLRKGKHEGDNWLSTAPRTELGVYRGEDSLYPIPFPFYTGAYIIYSKSYLIKNK